MFNRDLMALALSGARPEQALGLGDLVLLGVQPRFDRRGRRGVVIGIKPPFRQCSGVVQLIFAEGFAPLDDLNVSRSWP